MAGNGNKMLERILSHNCHLIKKQPSLSLHGSGYVSIVENKGAFKEWNLRMMHVQIKKKFVAHSIISVNLRWDWPNRMNYCLTCFLSTFRDAFYILWGHVWYTLGWRPDLCSRLYCQWEIMGDPDSLQERALWKKCLVQWFVWDMKSP